MRVLIGCEESGVIRREFKARGHQAWSNDLLQSRDSSPDHLQCDVIEAIFWGGFWDLIILHPPCTALAVSGNRWYGYGKPHHFERERALEWTKIVWDLAKQHSHRVALENPVGVLPDAIGKPAQYIQPWQFGHGETKKTGLWLHNLPELKPTDVVTGREQRIWKMPPSPDRSMLRSQTYRGVACAMAEQWGIL